MIKFGKIIVKYRILILIICVLLLVPSIYGMINTRINYDMLVYLPEDMDTVKGQNILLDDFNKGAFSIVIVEGMEPKDISALKEKIKQVDHVESVVWYDNALDISVPMEMLPDEFYKEFNNGDATLMAIFFDTSTSADETINAIKDVRSVSGKQCFVSGLSALVTDLKDLCEQEEPVYVGIAVVLACIAMMIFLDSWILPLIFLASIGMAILYNMGSNYFLGEISYITKALSAVLQLGVTMDYSIFLWHSYNEEKEIFIGDKKKAMAHAITNTFSAIIGSSLTTITGFIALCFMSFTLGLDLGIIMAKGVLLGVIGCVTTLPALILVFDKAIEKTRHKPLIPNFNRLAKFITKRSWIFLIIFILVLFPALYGYRNTKLYYEFTENLPQDMDYIIANTKLSEEFNISSTHMILANADMSTKDTQRMINEIDGVAGVKKTLGLDSVIGSTVPKEMLPDSILNIFENDKYQLLLINSEYKAASDEVNNQIDNINTILKKYDSEGMLIGEASCTKDLITVTDHDFRVVSIISIFAIFLLIAFVLKSASLPIILVAVIEFAIFINLGLPYYTDVSLPFVAPICISTIQLGATVDYAILMTTRYKKERFAGKDKYIATTNALIYSIPSIIVSAAGFFASTFGVSIYSDIDIISSMCSLMARGAIISMLSVIFILPAMFMLFDKFICKTTVGFKKKNKNQLSAKMPERN